MQHRAIIAYVNQPRQKLERLRQPGQAISRGARKDASPYCYNPASCPIKKRPSKNFNYGRDYRRFHDTEPVGSLKSQIDGSSRFAHALGSGCIVAVAGSRERIGARRAFCPSLVTVALEQRLARAKCRSPASRRADCCSGKPAAATVLMPVFNNLVLFDKPSKFRDHGQLGRLQRTRSTTNRNAWPKLAPSGSQQATETSAAAASGTLRSGSAIAGGAQEITADAAHLGGEPGTVARP
jgi:hypothetical protein